MAEEYKYEYFNVSFPAEYVAHVEINRPEKLNAFVEQMWLNLSALTNRLSHDSSVRVIIITGAGERAFSAGLDVQFASSQGAAKQEFEDPARKANSLRRHILEFQSCISSLEHCEKPIITVLHGTSYGLALDLSLATDIRIATPSTRFSIKEVDIGIAADIGSLSRLPKAVGSFSWVKDVCITARVFDGEEAFRVGLVSGLYKDKNTAYDEALSLAQLIASKSPVATMGTKELLNYSRDHSVADGLKYTSAWNAAMVQARDFKDAMLSGLKRTKPTFSKL